MLEETQDENEFLLSEKFKQEYKVVRGRYFFS